jgi:eukaryotic-like serine/threonine-protein kinase
LPPCGSKRLECAPRNIEHGSVTSAETAYLFRHALVRDAAYGLQLPTDRARLHELAFHILELAFGGRAPDPPILNERTGTAQTPHSTDSVSRELAAHAGLAKESGSSDGPEMRRLHCLYTQRAAEHAQWSYRISEALDLWEQVSNQQTGDGRAEALRRVAVVAHNAGLQEVAAGALLRAIEVCRTTGNRAFEGMLLHNLALHHVVTSQLGLAERASLEAVAALKDGGNRSFQGVVLGGLAAVYHESGRLSLAEQTYERALEYLRERKNSWEEGNALSNLAVIYALTGRAQPAVEKFEHALHVYRAKDNHLCEGITLANMAYMCHAEGAEAEPMLDQAITLLRKAGGRSWEGIALGYRGALRLKSGRAAMAEKDYALAIAIDREAQNHKFEGIHLCELALCMLVQGRADDAASEWRAGAAILEQIGDAAERTAKVTEMREACATAGVPVFE